MHTQFKEFDRALTKTSTSRSIKFARPKNAGFTLIELLVVISIIALLSTVVLAAVQDGRVKARNTAKNDTVLQYINALELYASDNDGNYPESGLSGSTYTYSCLGFEENEGCFKINGSNVYTGLSSLISSLDTYYPGLPKADEIVITVGTLERKGIMYIKYGDNYKLRWYLDGDTQCIRGAETTSFGNYTQCTYPEL